MDWPPRLFCLIAIAFGLAFVALTPPMGSPDEHVHLARAFLISEGHFAAPGSAPGAQADFPRSLVALHTRMAHAMPGRAPRRYNAAELSRLFDQPLAPEERTAAGYLGAYSPVAYAPQATAILLGRLFEPSPAALLYLGRLANLLFYVGAGWLALRHTPVRRWALCLFLLAPMSLAQAVSLSADAPTLALSALFVALACRSAFGPGERMSGGALVALVTTAALVGLSKPGYWALAGLVFLIPSERFRDLRHRALACAAVVVAMLGPSLLWLIFTRAGQLPLPAPLADPEAQLLFVLENPVRFLKTVFATLIGGSVLYLRSFVGVLGHLNVPLPSVLYVVYPLALGAAALADSRDSPQLNRGRRAALVGLFALGAGCVFLLAYLGWNAVGAALIHGVQGRYFTPLVPLALLALPGLARKPSSPRLALATGSVAVAALGAAAHALWRGFW